jgi:diguanylate cyclase (GGDEF)-like protein
VSVSTAFDPLRSAGFARNATGVLSVALLVFAASLFGIFTRPVGSLAAFWPANALLLGVMVRYRSLSTLAGWVAAFVAYVAADLSTGGQLRVTLWLSAANMAGAFTGYLLFRLLPEDDRRLRRPLSVLYLFVICTAAALAAALSGGGIARLLFGRDFLTGLEFWFTTELVNNLVILPMVLAFPGLPKTSARVPGSRREDRSLVRLGHAMPAAALLTSCVAGVLVGGPGAIAFPVPALIWCALSYGMFATAFLTMLLCAWLMLAVSGGLLRLPMAADAMQSVSSLRLGIALIALGPLTVASINAARNDVLAKLMHAVDHDCLTGTLSRGAFLSRACGLLAESARTMRPAALLMMDLDHFKKINDGHGHAAGDKVLVAFAGLVGVLLREGDVLGRLGGEEFAVLLPGVGRTEAVAIADRIRHAAAGASVVVSPDVSLRISVSIGVAVADAAGHSLDQLMAAADGALYLAKSGGRNAVRAAA